MNVTEVPIVVFHHYMVSSTSTQQTIVSDLSHKIQKKKKWKTITFRNLLDENARLGLVNKSHVLYPFPPNYNSLRMGRNRLLMRARL